MSYHSWCTASSNPAHFASYYLSPSESILFIGSLEEPHKSPSLRSSLTSSQSFAFPKKNSKKKSGENNTSGTKAAKTDLSIQATCFVPLQFDDPTALCWLPLNFCTRSCPSGLLVMSSYSGLLSLYDPSPNIIRQYNPLSKFETFDLTEETSDFIFEQKTNQAIFNLSPFPYASDHILTVGSYEVHRKKKSISF